MTAPHGADEIDAELASLSELRERPAGTVRITAGAGASTTLKTLTTCDT